MDNACFEWSVRVYYEDTDCARVVYYANYLKFLERARTEWLRHLGWNQDAMIRDLNLLFVVAGVEIKYKKPARLDDALIVRCRIKDCRSASMFFEQEIWRGDELLVSAVVKCGCLDATTLRPKIMPAQLIEQMQGN